MGSRGFQNAVCVLDSHCADYESPSMGLRPPDVLAHARSSGWDLRPGVRLELGRWQEVVPRLVDSGATFDAVYYDTYAETYADLRAFLLWLPRLRKARHRPEHRLLAPARGLGPFWWRRMGRGLGFAVNNAP